jgi:hypothetical protein
MIGGPDPSQAEKADRDGRDSAVEAQGPERDYAFHTLGWLQFQRLAESVLTETFGQTVQHFEPGRDGGRDAAFFGTWSPTAGETYAGSFMFQIKYTSIARQRLVESVLADEVAKAKEQRAEGRCDNYFVLTNFAARGEQVGSLEISLREMIGCPAVRVFDTSWLTQTIRNSSELRMLVPRVYGLGDLSEILDERAFAQARALLSSLGERLQTFVPTAASHAATLALRDHGFVLLVGNPMTGKTTISSAIALGAIDHLKQRVVKIGTAAEFIRHWNTDRNAKQMFWIDDAFGQTHHELGLTQAWSSRLESIRAAVQRGTSVLMTTRTYIWNEARKHLKRYLFPEFEDRKIVIELSELTPYEKMQMLYHHLRIGRQTSEYRMKLRPMLSSLADVDPFFPEVARRIADPMFTGNLQYPTPESLRAFFERPTQMLVDMIQGLNPAQRALLAILFAHGGSVESPFSLTDADRTIAERFGAWETEVLTSLRGLDGSLIRYSMDLQGRASHDYAHPTIRDAVAEITGAEPEWLDIYLQGSDVEHILDETTAGPTHGYGVKVRIPEARFEAFVDRLAAGRKEMKTDRDRVHWYLAFRTSDSFLRCAVKRRPELFDVSTYYSYTDSSDDVFLVIAGRLAKAGVLPESVRENASERMRDYARESLAFLQLDEVRAILSDAERADILALARDVQENLSELRWTIRSNYSPSLGPEGAFSQFFTYADELITIFPGDSDVKRVVDAERERAKSELAALYADYDPDDGDRTSRPTYTVRELSERNDDIGQRDIFSDVADPV